MYWAIETWMFCLGSIFWRDINVRSIWKITSCLFDLFSYSWVAFRLVFGDGTSTPFLGEAEVEAYKLSIGHYDAEGLLPLVVNFMLHSCFRCRWSRHRQAGRNGFDGFGWKRGSRGAEENGVLGVFGMCRILNFMIQRNNLISGSGVLGAVYSYIY